MNVVTVKMLADTLAEMGFSTVNESFYKKVDEWKSWYEGTVKSFSFYKVKTG